MTKEGITSRAERTCEAIKNATISLITECDFDQITVTQVVNRANVSRKTFYRHFSGIDDLVDEIQLEIAEKVVDKYNEFSSGPFDVAAISKTLVAVLGENLALSKRLAAVDTFRGISRSVKDLIKTALIARLCGNDGEEREAMNFVAEYCVTGAFKIYKIWFSEPSSMTLEEVTNLVCKLVFEGISDAINISKENKNTR